MAPDPQGTDVQSDLIDTAIVIKNIPFGYPEEDFLTKLFPQLGLAPPYAFNYHRNRNDGSFHGLAFANFNAPHEAQAAVDMLNNYELERRRLRVELKKKLPAEEEQRARLARQSRRQFSQQTPQSTGFTQSLMGSQEVLQPLQAVDPLPMASEILDPQLRPRIVPRGASTPTSQTGTFNMRILLIKTST
jgi:RNA recognition motif-containing protein